MFVASARVVKTDVFFAASKVHVNVVNYKISIPLLTLQVGCQVRITKRLPVDHIRNEHITTVLSRFCETWATEIRIIIRANNHVNSSLQSILSFRKYDTAYLTHQQYVYGYDTQISISV